VLSFEARRAVVCHELLHVARRDWLWLWLEEAIRTVFWFHPFMRWAIGQVRLGREQTVDAQVVGLTGTRRAYMDAIIRFAGPQPAIGLGMPFAGRQHVVSRLKALGQERKMSRTRIAFTGTVLTLLLAAASWSIAGALPLPGQTPSGPDPLDAGTSALTQPVTLRFSNASVAAILNSLGTISGIRITYETGFEDRRYSVEFRAVPPRDALRQVLSDNDLTYRGVDEKTIVVSPRGAIARFPAPLRVGQDIQTPPRKIFEVKPIYPEDAKAAKIQGVVLLDVTVGTDGTVKGLRLVKSVPLLDQAAMDAVNQWQFEPALLNGVPVEVEVTITINFTLR
jgi:TonB family protein